MGWLLLFLVICCIIFAAGSMHFRNKAANLTKKNECLALDKKSLDDALVKASALAATRRIQANDLIADCYYGRIIVRKLPGSNNDLLVLLPEGVELDFAQRKRLDTEGYNLDNRNDGVVSVTPRDARLSTRECAGAFIRTIGAPLVSKDS